MSETDRDYKVGYGRPPKSKQFKPGQSGNKKGRPRKRTGGVDIDAVLDQPIAVTSTGKREMMEPRKLVLLAQIKKAQDGDLGALTYVLDQFATFGVLGNAKAERAGGALVLPSEMPFAMAEQMAARFGAPPWSKRQIAAGRDRYLATRSDEQACDDELMGYPAL